MKILNPDNLRGNWHGVLAAWNIVENWGHYKQTDLQLQQQLKALIISLWNEKDWTKKRHPLCKNAIEQYVDDSKYLKVIADMANALKHGGLDLTSKHKARSDAEDTNDVGSIEHNDGISRTLYFYNFDGEVIELYELLRGAIGEYDALERMLRN